MDQEIVEKLEALRERVARPSPMDPWTWGRISPPLLELIGRWRDLAERQTEAKGFAVIALHVCANDLAIVVDQWDREAQEVGREMEQEHMEEEARDAAQSEDPEFQRLQEARREQAIADMQPDPFLPEPVYKSLNFTGGK